MYYGNEIHLINLISARSCYYYYYYYLWERNIIIKRRIKTKKCEIEKSVRQLIVFRRNEILIICP